MLFIYMDGKAQGPSFLLRTDDYVRSLNGRRDDVILSQQFRRRTAGLQSLCALTGQDQRL